MAPRPSRRHGNGRWRTRWGRAARFSPRCCRTCFIAGVRIPRISPLSWSTTPTPSCIGSGRSYRSRRAVPRSITCDSTPIHRWRRGHSFNPCCPTCRISSPVINLGLCLIRSPARCRSPDRFADGGSLENTGIAALLAYSDIDSVIAFINPSVPIQPAAYGVANEHGGFLPDTALVIDDSIPPLFGYQPYGAGRPGETEGYVPYGRGPSERHSMYANNQIFEQAAFPALLQGLWSASGNGSYVTPAIFTQRLAVLPNMWFGVSSAREVTVVWFYLGFVTTWAELFASNSPSGRSSKPSDRRTAFRTTARSIQI